MDLLSGKKYSVAEVLWSGNRNAFYSLRMTTGFSELCSVSGEMFILLAPRRETAQPPIVFLHFLIHRFVCFFFSFFLLLFSWYPLNHKVKIPWFFSPNFVCTLSVLALARGQNCPSYLHSVQPCWIFCHFGILSKSVFFVVIVVITFPVFNKFVTNILRT